MLLLHLMSRRLKNGIYTLLLLAAVFVVWKYRTSAEPSYVKQTLAGNTMGTTYSIIYFGESLPNLKNEVDSLLVSINASLNTYLEDSEISRFNRSKSIQFDLPWFYPVLKRSFEINASTQGAFDPTVMPLVNIWGFGPGEALYPDSTYVDSLLQFVGVSTISFSEKEVRKSDPRTQLDFSAIAKGYGVDVVSKYLTSKGLSNHFVEIGGETYCAGINMESDREWVTGILDPRSTQDNLSFFALLSSSDNAIATSGNYFNYRIRDGVRYSHTISPDTGYPIELNILSATVVAQDCMTADALATSFMVMGHEKAIDYVQSNDDIDALIIYSEEGGEISHYASEGIIKKLSIE